MNVLYLITVLAIFLQYVESGYGERIKAHSVYLNKRNKPGSLNDGLKEHMKKVEYKTETRRNQKRDYARRRENALSAQISKRKNESIFRKINDLRTTIKKSRNEKVHQRRKDKKVTKSSRKKFFSNKGRNKGSSRNRKLFSTNTKIKKHNSKNDRNNMKASIHKTPKDWRSSEINIKRLTTTSATKLRTHALSYDYENYENPNDDYIETNTESYIATTSPIGTIIVITTTSSSNILPLMTPPLFPSDYDYSHYALPFDNTYVDDDYVEATTPGFGESTTSLSFIPVTTTTTTPLAPPRLTPPLFPSDYDYSHYALPIDDDYVEATTLGFGESTTSLSHLFVANS